MNTVVGRLGLLTITGFALLLSVPRPASADIAEGWSDPPPVSGLDMLWILLGAPVLCYVVVALLAYLPGLVKGEKTPSKSLERDDTWFRDPRL
ncbi:MAG: hypothetical protein ACRCYU_01865 [Nocardioides sp.]